MLCNAESLKLIIQIGHFVVKFDTYVKDDNSIFAEPGTAVINLAQQGAMP